jgi:diguanylate cyclase (GGDEF)-like protein/PAS domain S-box-containing protein
MSFLSTCFTSASSSLKFRVVAGVVAALTTGIGAATAFALHAAATQAIEFQRTLHPTSRPGAVPPTVDFIEPLRDSAGGHGVLTGSLPVASEEAVWRARSENGLLAAIDRARRTALVAAALLALALSALAWLFIHRQLRPLESLEQRARHLVDGLFDPREGWPLQAGEIGRLGQALRRVVAERAELEAGKALAMKKLHSVMSAAPVGIAFTRSTRFELVGAEFCRLFGRSEHELLGRSPRILHATPEDDQLMAQAIGAAFDAGEPYVGEWRMRHADGHLFWVRLRGRAVDPLQPRAATIWTAYDIDEEVSRREQLEWSASHDALTGLHNRRSFERALTRVFHARPDSLPSALVLIDLDHFKPINDTAGHAAGDAMLKAVANAICAHVRVSDLVARLGGDEFALLLEHCSLEAAVKAADNVRQAVHAVGVAWEGLELRVGASLGVAPLTAHSPDMASWLAAADAACYAAKADGRGAVRVSDGGTRDALYSLEQAPAE